MNFGGLGVSFGALGSTGGVAAGGGGVQPTSLLKLLPNPGGNMSSGANWEETDFFRVEAEAPFTRVRIWMFSQDATSTTGWRCIVAPTETGLNDTFTHCYDPTSGGAVNNSLWKTVLFGGGTGTMPANSGATRQGVMVSDWCTVASVARAGGEGTTRPLLLCRPYHNSSVGGTHTSQNYAGVHSSSASAFYRRFEVGAKVGNGLDTLSFQPTQLYDDGSSGFPFAVEFDYGLTTAKPVLSVGDSITAGTFTDLTNSSAFGWIAAGVMGLSTAGTPYSIANGGAPGQNSTTFFNEANDMLDLGLRPAYIVLPSFSVNDASTDNLTTTIIDAYYVKVDALIAKVAGYSPKPKFIGWTGLPRNSYTTTSEAARQYAHTQMRNRVTATTVYKCVEISASIQDGSTPPDLQAIYDAGDGTHPNGAARPVMAALLAAAFSIAVVFNPSFDTLFAKTSLWNATPVAPVLGTTVIPDLNELATVTDDAAFGVRFFLGTAADPAATINVDASEDQTSTIVVPHWPASAVAPTGSDASVEVFDETTGLIHSCWGFSNGPPKHAAKYSCERYDGLGWGTPERPDGTRGAGITVASGTLRAWETSLSEVGHALAVVMGTPSHIRNLPVFPATEQDAGDHTANFVGPFPYGQFWMLPPTFNYSGFLTEMAKKIARTLIKRGCYLIDLGAGGWVICAEYGGTWSTANQWNGTECPDIEAMKRALRPVTSVAGWLDANGAAFTPIPWANMNLLSMRGPWDAGGSDPAQAGNFRTQTARYEFPVTSLASINVAKTIYLVPAASLDPTHEWWNGCWHTNPIQGASYTLRALGDAGVTGSINIFKGDWSSQLFSSNVLAPGQSQVFTMPSDATGINTQVNLTKVAGGAAGIRLELTKT